MTLRPALSGSLPFSCVFQAGIPAFPLPHPITDLLSITSLVQNKKACFPVRRNRLVSGRKGMHTFNRLSFHRSACFFGSPAVPLQDPRLCAPRSPRVYLFGNVNYSVFSMNWSDAILPSDSRLQVLQIKCRDLNHAT